MTKSKALPMDSTSLAIERTQLANERTLMAWIRTSTSLISFGFTIYKFFQYLVTEGMVTKVPQGIGTRHFGMVMILLGIFGLLFATIQHRQTMIRLRPSYPAMPRSLSEITAFLILLLGLLLFLATLFKQ